jgi:hypothetical protein
VLVEIAVVLLILVLIVAGGLATVVVLGGSGSDALPGWAGRRLTRPSVLVRPPRVIDVAPEDSRPVGSRLELAAREETNTRLEALAVEVRTLLAADDDRVARYNLQLEALHHNLRDRLDVLGRDASERWSELAARQSALEARQEAATERLRADLAWHFIEHDRQVITQRNNAERANVTAELYALLAQLEAAVAAVTNPVLLPGEPYAPPADLLPETLVWENWKEVGERAFAFADLYNDRRLYLSEATRAESGAFVAELRLLLTESIYPNLRPNVGPTQRDRLHEALVTLAARFPEVRAWLERDFRSVAEAQGDNPQPESGARDALD